MFHFDVLARVVNFSHASANAAFVTVQHHYENLRHASAPVFCELFGKAVSYILLGRSLSRFGGPNSNLASYPSHLEKESVREYLLPLIFTQQQYL